MKIELSSIMNKISHSWKEHFVLFLRFIILFNQSKDLKKYYAKFHCLPIELGR